jgi:hypothetical protein
VFCFAVNIVRGALLVSAASARSACIQRP